MSYGYCRTARSFMPLTYNTQPNTKKNIISFLFISAQLLPLQPLNQKQISRMKKFFAVIAIAGALVACNNASEGTESADTTAIAPDTTTLSVDTTTIVDTTAAAAVDTTAAATVDSAAAH